MIDSLIGVGSSLRTGAPIGGANAGAQTAATSGPSFAEVLEQVAGGAVQSVRSAEAASISGIQGNASVQQVVEAVMSAEQNLQAAIAIRDKVVAAYQEISRMAI